MRIAHTNKLKSLYRIENWKIKQKVKTCTEITNTQIRLKHESHIKIIKIEANNNVNINTKIKINKNSKY